MKFFSSRVLACFTLALLAPLSFGAKEPRTEVQAQVLDRNEYLCSNCFFGTSGYYSCFDAGDKVLIGYQKIPQLNWKEHNTNLLTRVHKAYIPWEPPAAPIALHYDSRFLYVTGADGKEVKLRQNYQTDVFINSAKCRAAIKKP